MIAPITIILSLTCFWGVSLVNILKKNHVEQKNNEESNPLTPVFYLALLGTVLLFAEALIFTYFSLTGREYTVNGSWFTPNPVHVFVGAFLFACGSLLHAWSVNVRGIHAVSWNMPKNHRLIQDPPYRYVRHPSYLGYILMILSMTLIWGNIVTLIPWVAIPGYYFISKHEETILIEKFGQEYLEYMKQVKGFIPWLRKNQNTP